MNSSFISEYKPAIILTLALAVFLASCKPPTTTPGKSWVVTTLAGSSTAGDKNGTGTAAQFDKPHGVAVDSSGNVYVADTDNHRIRKITLKGVVSTLAGSTAGYNPEDAIGTEAQFSNPFGVAVDSDGNVYVADTDNHRIRKITSARVVSTLAGDGTTAQFSFPAGVAVDSDNNVYVADSGNHRIRKITSTGGISTLAGNGSAGDKDATGTEARFRNPYDVAVDSSGILYVADYHNHRIRKITSEGVVTTLAGNGTAGDKNGAGTAAQFNYPSGVAVDSSGILYVADYSNNRIRKITSEGKVTTLAGNGSAGDKDATGTEARFRNPNGVAVDSSGILYVADSGNNRIRKIEYK